MTDPKDIAVENSQPGKFSLIERLQNRGMPEEDVKVWLDEKLGWELVRLEEAHSEAKTNEEAVALEEKIADVKQRLRESTYIFTLRGVSNETYDSLVKRVEEQFPLEYNEVTNPLTGLSSKVLIENEDRDDAFNTIFLAEVIVRVTDPDGNVDEDIDEAAVTFIKNKAPLDAIRRISNLAFKMRMVGEWMDAIQDEDFSPRP